MLLEAISAQYPFESLFEAGCAIGQNFATLYQLFPSARMQGIDLDEESVALALGWAKREKVADRVHFERMDVRDLRKFGDGEFDCVISSAFLLYIGAREIQSVASELLRIASRSVILLEQHQESSQFADQHLGVKTFDHNGGPAYWVRDYRKLFHEAAPRAKIELAPVRNPRWQTEQWGKLATVITVSKEPPGER